MRQACGHDGQRKTPAAAAPAPTAATTVDAPPSTSRLVHPVHRHGVLLEEDVAAATGSCAAATRPRPSPPLDDRRGDWAGRHAVGAAEPPPPAAPARLLAKRQVAALESARAASVRVAAKVVVRVQEQKHIVIDCCSLSLKHSPPQTGCTPGSGCAATASRAYSPRVAHANMKAHIVCHPLQRPLDKQHKRLPPLGERALGQV